MGGTALLTSMGVPPVAAYAISSGVTNAAFEYEESKDPEKAAETGVKSGVGGAVGAEVGNTLGLTNSDPDGSNALWIGLATGIHEASQQCNSGGSWDCELEPYPCPEELFNYKYINIPFQCETSCEVNVIRETIATPCCREVNCASRIKDLECQKRNAFCRITRQKAMLKLNSAKKNILKPLMELQQAKEVFNIAHIELVKRKLELEAASGERDTLRRAHSAILKGADILFLSNEKSRAFIQDAIALTQLWNSTNETFPLDINEISFDVTLSSPSETQIPVLFKIASASKEKNIYSMIDFVALNDSLQRTAKQIVNELFGNVNVILRSGHPLNQLKNPKGNGRRRRAIDEPGSDVTKLVEYKRKCALVTNYNRALSDIIGTLYNISRKSLRSLNNVKNLNSEKYAEFRNPSLNLTQAAEFGLSEKDIDDSINAVESDKEVKNAASLIEIRNATNHRKVQTAIDMVFRDWEASMETVFNRTSLECSGFIDCMEDFVENFLFLYQGIDLPEAILLRQQIAILGQEVKSLLSYEDLSVSEAANKASNILKRLKDTRDANVFCAVAPNITQHPVPIKNLKIGQTLELSCKATGDPAPTYRWRKNGEIIPGRKTNTFRIEKVAKADDGNYTCEAYNHLSVEPSTPSHIVIHPPPALVYQPPRNKNVPLNTGFFMKCTATSVSKPLRYQWIYKPFGGENYTLVPNATFSVLNFRSVEKNKEGFYKCNASNPFDYTISHNIRLRILSFSLVVPSLGLSLQISGEKKHLEEAYNESISVIGDNVKFRQDVESGFYQIVSNLVDLPSDAVQDLSVEDCQMISQRSGNISCKVFFRLRSFNMTEPKTMNKTASENAVSVMDSAQQLERALAKLVNESVISGITSDANSVTLKLDPTSWSVGKYISLCPIGTVLYGNNFICVNCPPGAYGDINGTLPACFPCPLGTYQPDEGQTSCVPCPPGFTSGSIGLEDISSCQDLTLDTTTPGARTSQLSNVSTTLSRPSPTASLTTHEDDISSEEPKTLNVRSYHDVSFKWKIAFGVCLAVTIILLAGMLLYGMNYRVKKIRRFGLSNDDSTKKSKSGHTFQNPVYDDTEVHGQAYTQSNVTYELTEPPAKKKMVAIAENDKHMPQNPLCIVPEADNQDPLECGHVNPAYQMTGDTDREMETCKNSLEILQ